MLVHRYFTKTIFTFKSVFHKDDFEWIQFSNKHHKSHVWPKNFKKQKMYFLTTLAYQKMLGIVITSIEPLTYTSFLNGFGHAKITFKFRIWLIHIHLILRLGKKSKKTITKYVYIYIYIYERVGEFHLEDPIISYIWRKTNKVLCFEPWTNPTSISIYIYIYSC